MLYIKSSFFKGIWKNLGKRYLPLLFLALKSWDSLTIAADVVHDMQNQKKNAMY